MSSYCTTQDLIDRDGEDEIRGLTDFQRAEDLNSDVIERAIAGASSEIDGYLTRRYAVPLASAPDRIVEAACVLARCRLYVHDRPEDAAADCEAERAWLQRVADGRLDVPGLVEKTGAQSAGSPQFESDERVFTRDTLSDF
jgi:phage gp36-like protein